MFINDTLLKMTTDLTTATLSNSAIRVDAASGEQVADFMQKIYEKLVELNDNDSNQYIWALAEINSARAFVFSAISLSYSFPDKTFSLM